MGQYGGLPVTGPGSIIIGGVAISYPIIAVIGAALVVGGALLLRKFRPAKVVPTDDE